MAIDNREKRQSAASAGMVFMAAGVTPNASKDGEWRQQVGWGYSGNALGAVIGIIKQIIISYMRINT